MSPGWSRRTRRDVLGAASVAGALSLAGCLETVRDFRGGRETDQRDDVLRYETLEVGGSPGTELPLRAVDRPTLVDFFATWCGPCRDQMYTLRKVRREFDSEEVAMFSVSPEADESAVRDFWTRHEGAWPVAVDPEGTAIRKYSVTGIPTLVVVSPDGTVHWRHKGIASYESMAAEIRGVGDG